MALVQLARFADPNEGEIAANALRAEGIEAVFNSDGLATANFLLRNATGGYPLWVLSDDVAEARRLLREALKSAAKPEQVSDDDEGDALEDRRLRRRRFRLIVLTCFIVIPTALIAILIVVSALWPSY